jgi:hypothetical protein
MQKHRGVTFNEQIWLGCFCENSAAVAQLRVYLFFYAPRHAVLFSYCYFVPRLIGTKGGAFHACGCETRRLRAQLLSICGAVILGFSVYERS